MLPGGKSLLPKIVCNRDLKKLIVHDGKQVLGRDGEGEGEKEMERGEKQEEREREETEAMCADQSLHSDFRPGRAPGLQPSAKCPLLPVEQSCPAVSWGGRDLAGCNWAELVCACRLCSCLSLFPPRHDRHLQVRYGCPLCRVTVESAMHKRSPLNQEIESPG